MFPRFPGVDPLKVPPALPASPIRQASSSFGKVHVVTCGKPGRGYLLGYSVPRYVVLRVTDNNNNNNRHGNKGQRRDRARAGLPCTAHFYFYSCTDSGSAGVTHSLVLAMQAGRRSKFPCCSYYFAPLYATRRTPGQTRARSRSKWQGKTKNTTLNDSPRNSPTSPGPTRGPPILRSPQTHVSAAHRP